MERCCSLSALAVVILIGLIGRGHGVGLPEVPGTQKLEWSYEDVALWPNMFPDYCAGTSQSPIDVSRFSSSYSFILPFTFTAYNAKPSALTATNNGHTVTVSFDAEVTPTISGGGLHGQYALAQYHLHWGSDGTRGSEHTIETVRYPMELHLVHFKTEYGTIADAVGHSDGLAVLGIMFELSNQDNPALAPLIAKLTDIETTGTNIGLDSASLYGFSSLLPGDLTKFYRYEGGLTTPTCNEVVVWTVFTDPIRVSENQLVALRTLMDSHSQHIENNYRPVQPLNGRRVRRSFIL